MKQNNLNINNIAEIGDPVLLIGRSSENFPSILITMFGGIPTEEEQRNYRIQKIMVHTQNKPKGEYCFKTSGRSLLSSITESQTLEEESRVSFSAENESLSIDLPKGMKITTTVNDPHPSRDLSGYIHFYTKEAHVGGKNIVDRLKTLSYFSQQAQGIETALRKGNYIR